MHALLYRAFCVDGHIIIAVVIVVVLGADSPDTEAQAAEFGFTWIESGRLFKNIFILYAKLDDHLLPVASYLVKDKQMLLKYSANFVKGKTHFKF